MAYVIMNKKTNLIYGRGIVHWKYGTVYDDFDAVKKAIIVNIFSPAFNKNYYEYVVSKYEDLAVYNIFNQDRIDLLDLIQDMLNDPKVNWTVCKQCNKIKHVKRQTLDFICNDCLNRSLQ